MCVCAHVKICPLTIMLGLDTPKYQLEARRERLNIQRTPDPSPVLGFKGADVWVEPKPVVWRILF